MPAAVVGGYYLPLASGPEHSSSDSSPSRSPSPSPLPPSSVARALARTSRFALFRRAYLAAAGIVAAVLVVGVTSGVDRNVLQSRVRDVLEQGQGVYDDAISAVRESRLLGSAQPGGEGGRGGAAGSARPTRLAADIVPSQARVGGSVQVETTAVGNVLDHGLLLPEPTTRGVCSPAVQERLGRPDFWTITRTERLKYHIAPRDATTASDLPTTCLAHAVFSARLVSLAADGSTPDPADTQTLFALDPPIWHPDSSTYLVVLPVGPPIPHRHYELDVRLEFGYYPGIQEGTPCGPRELKCKPQSLAAQGGKAMRYVGEAIPTRQVVEYGAGAAEEEEEVSAAGGICDDLSSLTGYWNTTTFHSTSPACSLSTPSLPLSDALYPAAVDDKPARPLWLHLVGDSNTRNTYKRLISALGRGFHATGPMVMDSATHNGTQAGLAFRYRTGVPPEDESAQVPDLVVTWMWWYQVAPLSSAGFMGMGDRAAEDVDPEFRANRDELLSFVDADLSTFLGTARLDAVLKTFPHLREVARGLRPHRTYLSLGSHGEDLSVPGVAASLDVLFDEAHGLSRAKRDAANLRLVTTTLVNARYIPLAQFPHQDLVRTNALIHARNVYARGRPEFGGTEGCVLDVEALTRGVVEDEAWMKQGKRGPDAVHFRAEVYDVWVRVLWTDLVSGVAVEPTEGKRDSTAARRWRRRRLLPDLEDDSP